MRRGLLLVTVLALGVHGVFAQTNKLDAATPALSAELFRFNLGTRSVLSYDLIAPQTNPSERLAVSQQFDIQGPVVHVFKARKLWTFPKRLLSLLNPFRPRVHRPQATAPGIGRLSPRAWTSVVGWAPGQSAFPDPTTSTLGLTLISVNSTPP